MHTFNIPTMKENPEKYMAMLLHKIGMNVNHINGYCLDNLTHVLNNEQHVDDEAKRVLRVQRLVNEITEENWKMPLAKMEKRSKRRRVIRDIYDMYVQTAMGLMNEFNLAMEESMPIEKAYNTLCTQYKELVTYVNEELRKIRNRFSTSVTMVPPFDTL